MEILDGDVLPGETVTIDAETRRGQMTFEREAAKAART
jgi:hypothetical protein